MALDPADLAAHLAGLQQKTEQARVVLLALEQEVAAAEERLHSLQSPAHLLEANEQLVFAMLRAHKAAEITANELRAVSRAAETDHLTELPNRLLLQDRLQVALANAHRHNLHVALLFLDLNQFKQINDMLGHALGDEVLKQVAVCLSSSVRVTDTVSRYGGDEFLVLLTDIRDASEVVLIVEKIITALGAPLQIGNHVLRLSASIGISLYPDHGRDAPTLTDCADAAMYFAKRQGLGGYAFYAHEATPEPAPPTGTSVDGHMRFRR